MKKVELGKKYKDIVMGTEGICVSYTRFLTGCDRVNLEYKNKDGDVKSYHLDVSCCKEVKKFKQIIIPPQETEVGPKTGGPKDSSIKPEVIR